MKPLIIPCLLGLAALQAQAAITLTSTTSVAYNGQAASNTDLLQMAGVTVTLGGTYTPIAAGFGSPTTVLNNGSVGGSTTGSGDFPQSVCENGGAKNVVQYSVTYTLDLTGAANGYDLTSIASFSGWQDARASQAYNIWYTTTTNSTFVRLLSGTTVDTVANAFGANANNQGLKVAITDTTGIIASNVNAIRFDILPGAGGGTNFREFDVMGVPEPSAALLGGLGMLALLRRRRA